MQEGDATATRAASRRRIHELIAGGAAALERPIKVGHAIADVMNARPASRQEHGDRAVRIARLEQQPDDWRAGNELMENASIRKSSGATN